jgi:class 3 adenylate cyclase
MAKRSRIFKVETVGDCYVAVAGLPDPRKDHAVAIANFARRCMVLMHETTKKLEKTLGPDTSELSIRIGVHSGPVTAGVLRGDRSRFQLFGDTMNTAARIETTGRAGCIHVSEETANILIESGKDHWLTRRTEKVTAKGKGDLTTYWLSLDKNGGANTENTSMSGSDLVDADSKTAKKGPGSSVMVDNRENRLIDWNVETLLRLLKDIV